MNITSLAIFHKRQEDGMELKKWEVQEVTALVILRDGKSVLAVSAGSILMRESYWCAMLRVGWSSQVLETVSHRRCG